jgi:hypothetical protein
VVEEELQGWVALEEPPLTVWKKLLESAVEEEL